jgi:DNA-binding transcriptional LysR family regulator
MDIRIFQTFLVVAKLENITQAAEKLNFTQPTITAQIRALEESLGVELFERVGKKNFITEAGRQLIIYAGKLLNLYDEIQVSLQKFSADKAPIKVGVSTSAGSYVLSNVLREFQNRVFEGKVSIEVCSNVPVVIKGLLTNDFDFAICHDRVNHTQILQFDLLTEKLVWVVHRNLYEKYKNQNNIFSYPFINFRQNCVYRLKYEKIIGEKKLNSAIECSDSEAVKKAVLDGLGVSVLPEILVDPFLKNGTLVEFKTAPKLQFTLSVLVHKDKVLLPAMKTFLLLLSECSNIDGGLGVFLNQLNKKNLLKQ